MVNQDGQSVFDEAKSKKHTRLVRLLESKEAEQREVLASRSLGEFEVRRLAGEFYE
jgi:hypothetical protein